MHRFPRRFGSMPAGFVGLEEELFVVDRTTLAPASAPLEVLDGRHRKRELFREMIELTTGVHGSIPAAVAELAERRAVADAVLAPHGRGLLAAGTHPLAVPLEQEITPSPELRAFVEQAGPAARAQYCCGLHVHVSMPSARAAMAALERALPWLPVLLALSANSPYVAAAETGLASTRADLLRRLPRTGAPPAFRSFAAWERYAGRLVELGLADDYTRTWWDVRPHPRLGTLEVRICDQPTRLGVTATLAAAVRSLVLASSKWDPADRGIYDENRWLALRFGASARLIHPDGSRRCTLPELASELVGRLRPVAYELGDGEQLDRLQLLAARTQADWQLALGRRRGILSLVRAMHRSTLGLNDAKAG